MRRQLALLPTTLLAFALILSPSAALARDAFNGTWKVTLAPADGYWHLQLACLAE